MIANGPLIAIDVADPGGVAQPVVLDPQGAPATTPLIVPGFALVDTGASGSVVDDDLATRLGLIARGVANGFGVGGAYTASQYAIGWRITNTQGFQTVAVTSAPLHLQNPQLLMLIGRDILNNCVLVFNGPTGTFSLAW
jgi:hypothetical protein